MRPRPRNRIRSTLTEGMLSGADLSYLTGIPYAVVRRILRDGSDPPLVHGLKISGALGVPLESLFWLEASAPAATRSREAVG